MAKKPSKTKPKLGRPSLGRVALSTSVSQETFQQIIDRKSGRDSLGDVIDRVFASAPVKVTA